MIINVQKWGNSQGVRIPKSVLKELNIKMAFTAKGGKAHPKDPVYEIDRIFIDKHITDEQFMQILGYKQN